MRFVPLLAVAGMASLLAWGRGMPIAESVDWAVAAFCVAMVVWIVTHRWKADDGSDLSEDALPLFRPLRRFAVLLLASIAVNAIRGAMHPRSRWVFWCLIAVSVALVGVSYMQYRRVKTVFDAQRKSDGVA